MFILLLVEEISRNVTAFPEERSLSHLKLQYLERKPHQP